MQYSIELGIGEEFFYISGEGKLSKEPTFVTLEDVNELMTTFDWASMLENEPRFVIRPEGNRDSKTTAEFQQPDVLMRALKLAGSLQVVNTNLYRKMFWDERNGWYVTIEQKPGGRSPKVLKRAVSLNDALSYLLGEEE